MFKKVGFAPDGKIDILKKQIEFSTKPNEQEFYGIRYFDVQSSILETLYSLLPKNVHKDFYSSYLIINDDIPPHTDIVETAGFNCYIEPGNYITNFYDNTKNVIGTEYADHGEGHIYNASDLFLVGSFFAKKLEIFLINNKIIHEVVSKSLAKQTRQVLQLATNKYSYEEVVNMLRKK